MPSSPGPVGSTRMAFRMTIGLPRPWPGYPHHTGLISASCTSNPRFRHRLSSDPALRRTPLPRRMVPVITVHRGLPPPECTSLLDTPGETACPTSSHVTFPHEVPTRHTFFSPKCSAQPSPRTNHGLRVVCKAVSVSNESPAVGAPIPARLKLIYFRKPLRHIPNDGVS